MSRAGTGASPRRSAEVEIDGARLRDARRRRGLLQDDLSRASGYALRTIRRLERGEQRPHPRTVRDLAEALGVSLESLVRVHTPSERGALRATVRDEIERLTVRSEAPISPSFAIGEYLRRMRLPRFSSQQLVRALDLLRLQHAVGALEAALRIPASPASAFSTAAMITADALNAVASATGAILTALGVPRPLDGFPLSEGDDLGAGELNELVDAINLAIDVAA